MDQRRINDPRTLRAVAHPVRLSLLEQLMLHGPATASELGERLDESPANCSWHLRKLAEHGLVEEAGGGTGRKRPWQATSLGMTWDDSTGSVEEMVAGEELSRVLLEREAARLFGARSMLRNDVPEWQQASDVSQSLAWLTAEELRALNDQVRELLMAHMDRLQHPERRPEGARLCALVQWGVPTYDVPGPGKDPDERGEE